jgi:hypothetical protein
MPPRYSYWTIILEGKPTAFRAHTREELMPTFRQLQARHPEIVMMWFARGRLWESPEQERAAAARQRMTRHRRGTEWRPGGAHRDPRARFKVPRDEKRRRFAAKLRREDGERRRDSAPVNRAPETLRRDRRSDKRPQERRFAGPRPRRDSRKPGGRGGGSSR